ncbi:MAG: hypothetical protein A2722_00435 [Candidatus Doudnabacteria bacterium RIFCSPHIGHO2_01_FULL_50_11]|uniref:Uncharacterized protein n=1 Tax=Candidatus Doudnabacteria bacterium RIFCSPHIGHO2_01_FULL_50_11 TaxID=1817828 RepID=A0A1F5PHM5_9BACT|nr:MAG: hypothetical protein A2722_00435 [Candidatus Doudnabacteria bacterium RIFCSPHIGHO2_01_FULL_50_11]HLC44870.1 hypothetical protein [Patescibacteria group bacterium]
MKKRLRISLLILLFLLAAGAASSFAASPQNEQITVEIVIGMKQAGMNDEIILSLIESAEAVYFDTSVESVTVMKQAGLSDSVIGAIFQRQSKVTASAMPQGSLFLVRQGVSELELAPKQIQNSFVKSKSNTAQEIITNGGLTAGVYAGAGLISHLATMGALGRGALSMISGGIVAGVGMLGSNTPTVQGFNFEILPGKSATLLIVTGDAEFSIPLAPFHDGSYATAEPLLLRLTVSEKDGLRILSSEKVKVKGGDEPQQQSLGPKQFTLVEVSIAKTADTVWVKAQNLSIGEYALAFRAGDQFLPQAFDFRVVAQ